MTLLDSSSSESRSETQSRSMILVGVLAAVVVTALVIAGYSILRKRHQQRVLAAEQALLTATESKGPPKVQILVDDALLKGDQSLLGGTVKNISNEDLNDLAVSLELVRRKDGKTDKVSAPVDPRQLSPQQEGRYSLQLHAADYLSVRLAGLTSGNKTDLLTYVAGPGQKRPPEKLASRTIIVPRPGSSKGGFLNTPNNPGRVP